MKSLRRYPKPKERYEQYRLNSWSPLYGSVAFLFLSNPHRITGSKVYEDGPSRLAATPAAFVPSVSWQHEIGRYATYFPGANSQKLLFPANSRIQDRNAPISMYAVWKFDGSVQDQYIRLGGNRGNFYLWARNINRGSWSAEVQRWDDAHIYITSGSQSTFNEVEGWNVPCVAAPPLTYPKFYFNSKEYNNHTLVSNATSPFTVITIGAKEDESGNFELKGWVADFAIFDELLPDSYLLELSDKSNVDLRVGGIPLILPPKRVWWPAVTASVTVKKTPWHLMIQGAI